MTVVVYGLGMKLFDHRYLAGIIGILSHRTFGRRKFEYEQDHCWLCRRMWAEVAEAYPGFPRLSPDVWVEEEE
jgi:hypothetical protein